MAVSPAPVNLDTTPDPVSGPAGGKEGAGRGGIEPSSLLAGLALAGSVLAVGLAWAAYEPQPAATETIYLAKIAALVLAATAALAPPALRLNALREDGGRPPASAPAPEPALGAVLTVLALLALPAGATRGAAVLAVLVLAFASAAVRRFASRDAPEETASASRGSLRFLASSFAALYPLALGAQVLLRGELWLASLTELRTLVALAALPAAAALAGALLAARVGRGPAALALTAAFLPHPGGNVSAVLALLALAGTTEAADPRCSLPRRLTAFALALLPLAWDLTTGILTLAACLLWLIILGGWRSRPENDTGNGAGRDEARSAPKSLARRAEAVAGYAFPIAFSLLSLALVKLPPAASWPEAWWGAAACFLAVPAVVAAATLPSPPTTPSERRLPAPLDGLLTACFPSFLALLAVRAVPDPAALAAPLAVAVLVPFRCGIGRGDSRRAYGGTRAAFAAQGTWLAVLFAVVALSASYPWGRPSFFSSPPFAAAPDAWKWMLVPALMVIAATLLLSRGVRAAPATAPEATGTAAPGAAAVGAAAVGVAALVSLALFLPPSGEALIRKPTALAQAGARWSWDLGGEEVSKVVVESRLGNAVHLPEGTPALVLRFTGSGGEVLTRTVWVGRDTGEWAARRPDVAAAGVAAPAPWRVEVAAPGEATEAPGDEGETHRPFFAQTYRAVLPLPEGFRPVRLEAARAPALGERVEMYVSRLELAR